MIVNHDAPVINMFYRENIKMDIALFWASIK